ncbi:MAG: hypothetical protein ACREJN_20505, partial [Nitrospiraceae bacterium]
MRKASGHQRKCRRNATGLAFRHGSAPTILDQRETTLRIVAGVDWSDEAFAAVEQIGVLYRPE